MLRGMQQGSAAAAAPSTTRSCCGGCVRRRRCWSSSARRMAGWQKTMRSCRCVPHSIARAVRITENRYYAALSITEVSAVRLHDAVITTCEACGRSEVGIVCLQELRMLLCICFNVASVSELHLEHGCSGCVCCRLKHAEERLLPNLVPLQ
jgi:hypothetical protein